MFIIYYKKLFISLSILFMLGALFSIFLFGLKPGIDFVGGSITEVSYGEGENKNTTSEQVQEIDHDNQSEVIDQSEVNDSHAEAILDLASNTSTTTNDEFKTIGTSTPTLAEIKERLRHVATSTSEALVQETGNAGFIVRTKHLSEDDHKALISALSFDGKYQVKEDRFNTIGPTIGRELRNKAWVAVVAVLLGILGFVAFAFRHVSKAVSPWKYGIVAIIALLHDVLIPTGVMAVLGRIYGYEADILFITALLTILGFSVHDTIVVFDRIRENLIKKTFSNFSETVGKSLEQTLVRSVNTSLTVIFVLVALLWVGPPSIYVFSLILVVGILAGTYSSIFLASPLLVLIHEWAQSKSNK